MTPGTLASPLHAAHSLPGVRPVNEDRTYADPLKGWYAVLDGCGGPGKGDWASDLILRCLDEHADLSGALQEANARIFAAVQADPALKGSGATVAALRVTAGRAEILHAGEVRAYLVRESELRQLTEDQTLANQMVKLKQLTPEQAAVHPTRKALLQYIGKAAALKLTQHEVSLQPGDLLLLCSDGLYEAIPASALSDLHDCPAADLDARVVDVLQQALASGSSDNLSLLAVRPEHEAPSPGILASLLAAEDPMAVLATHIQALLATPGDRFFVASYRHAEPRVLVAHGAEPNEFESFSKRPGIVALPLGTSEGSDLVLYREQGPAQPELEARLLDLGALYEVACLREDARRQAARFALLNDLGRTVASTLNLGEVLQRLLYSTLELTQADTAYVIVPDGTTLQCRAGLNKQGDELTGLDISFTLANRVRFSREPLCILDTGADESAQTASVMALNLQSVMCVPMVVNDQLIGLLYVSSNFVTRSFTASDLDLLIAIAGQTAMSVQNAFFVSELDKKTKLEAELGIAHAIQMGMLPTRLPVVPGYSLAARCLPALEVGGDLFEVFPQASGQLGLFIGDVSGKNVSAALYMAVTHMAVRAVLPDSGRPLDGLKKLNAIVTPDFKDGSYVTALYVSLDPASGVGRYACAGHTPACIVRSDGQLEEVWQRGLFLGLDPRRFDETLLEAAFTLYPGDALVMFTDGLTEARNPEAEEFGDQRLHEALVAARAGDATDLLEAAYRSVATFVQDAMPFDDQTMLVIKRNESPASGMR